jgi:hypothetical protein
MMLRIIHGKLKAGTWDSYERAYKDPAAAETFLLGRLRHNRCEVRSLKNLISKPP